MMLRLLIILLLLAVPAHATVFINSGFEEVPIENGGWGYAQGWCFFPPMTTRQNPCPEMDTSTDVAFSGVRSLKQTFNAAWSDPNPQTHNQEIARVPHTGTIVSAGGNIWSKYQYRTVGFTYTAHTSTKQIYYKNYQNTAPTWVSNFFWGSRELGMSVQGLADLCPTNPASGHFQSCNLYPNMASVPLQNDQWYCIEEHIKFNTPGQQNGNVEIFVNGVQTLGYYNLEWLNEAAAATNAATGGCCNGWNLPTTVIDKVALFKQNGDGVRYFDDFVVADTRIGCGGQTDTTPPTVPTISSVEALSTTSLRVTHTLSTDSGSGVGTYEVDKCTGNGCSNFALATTTGAQATADLTGLSPSTTYTVRVRARDQVGNVSAYSNSMTGTTATPTGGGGGGGVATAPVLVFTTASQDVPPGVSSSYSFPITVPAGTDRLLTVCTAARDSTEAGDIAVNAVTANGVAMTNVRSDSRTPGPYWGTSLWRMVAPEVGTYNIAVFHAGNPPDQFLGAVAQGWTGVHQTTPIDAHNGANGSSTTPAVTVTTVTDHAALTDCASGQDDGGLTVGAGQTASVDRMLQPSGVNDSQGVSVVTDKATAGGESMNWTQGSSNWVISSLAIRPVDPVVTPPVPPVITGLACDATGCDLTYGATTPTTVRFLTDAGSEVVPIASIPGGRYTKPGGWPQTTTFICAFARDANGVESSDGPDYRCVSYTAGDTTAPTMSNPLPTGTVGSSTVILSVDTNEIATCLYSAANQSFDHMTLTMGTVTGLHHEVTLPGQADGAYTWYFQCADYNIAVEPITPLNKTTTAASTTYTVDSAPSDTTPPSDVVGLAVSAISPSQAQATFTAATDDVSVAFYRLYGCGGASCSTFSIVLTDADTTIDISNLTPGLPYTWKVKAVDTSNNESVNFSNAFTLTQPSDPTPGGDIVPPSIVRNCRVTTTTAFSLTLTCDQANDNFGVATYFFEACAGLACTDFETLGTATIPTLTHEGLTYNQIWTYRVIARDFSGNVSPAYSTPVVAVTPSTGWSMEQGFCPCRGRQR